MTTVNDTAYRERPRHHQRPHQPFDHNDHLQRLNQVHASISQDGDTSHPTASFEPGNWEQFADTITDIANAATPTPITTNFVFEFTNSAAKHNSEIIAHNNFDLEKAIRAQGSFSALSMGSELRPIEQLDQLLSHHPSYKLLRWTTIHGIDYPITHLSEDQRQHDLNEQLERGNHKSALVQEARKHVDKAMLSDIELGYSIPITIDCIRKLKHAEVYPIGLQHQQTIDETGAIIPKKRISHDHSNRKAIGRSINQRVIEEELPSVLYGHSLLRFLHVIHNIRRHHPNKPIVCNKIDIEKAYRRLHTNSMISSKCIATWTTPEGDEIGALLTRLPFGSSPAPAFFSVCSDIICDLANDLIKCHHWNPNSTPSPLQAMIPNTTLMDKDIAFGKALEPDVHLSAEITAATEGYIDDLATAALVDSTHLPQLMRAKCAVLMALHLIFRPHAGDNEPIQRPNAASIRKLKAEGRMAEQITYLGWLICTRSLTIALPNEKVKAWSKSIQQIIKSTTKISHAILATTIGRLNHVAHIIPQARHFLNRLRLDEQKADKCRSVNMPKETIKDLQLWLKFLQYARKGISINSIIFRSPTSISLSDACETGMGGYDPITGKAWRYKFTTAQQQAFTLNTKEFLAAVISQQLTLRDDKSPYPCHIAIGDSKVTEAWMYKSNHDPDSSPIQNEIARSMAQFNMNKKACNYSQHIRGDENTIADILSRDTHLTDQQVIALINAYSPPLLPKNFKLFPLSDLIISWIDSLVPLAPKTRELLWQHTPSTYAAGISGWNFCQKSQQMIPILTNLHKTNETQSFVSSWIQSRMENSTDNQDLLKAQLRERMPTMWQRSSQLVVGRIPDSTQPDKSQSNTKDN